MIGKWLDPRILFVSTYPPTRCGLATFSHALVDALTIIRGSPDSAGVIRMLPAGDESVCLGPEVVAQVSSSEPIDQAIVRWNEYDLLWIQHEYGIYGPEDGRAVLDLCDHSPVPVVVTLHTVPARMEVSRPPGVSMVTTSGRPRLPASSTASAR